MSDSPVSIWTAIGALLVSGLSFGVSYASYKFTRKSWEESHRPIVTARVVPLSDKHVAVELVLSNSGNRPAREVVIYPDSDKELTDSISANYKEWEKKSVDGCFRSPIPILHPGEAQSSPFGSIAQQDSPGIWKDDPTKLRIRIEYRDLDGRKYDEHQTLRIASIKSFGATVFQRREHHVEEVIQVKSPKPR